MEEFVEQFLVDRKKMHLRKLKTEKMIDLLRAENRASTLGGGGGNSGAGGGIPYPPSSFYPSTGPGGHGAPYPTGPFQMPMPTLPNMMFRHF